MGSSWAHINERLEPVVEHYTKQLTPAHAGARAIDLSKVNWADVMARFVATCVDLVRTLSDSEGNKRAAVVEAGVVFFKSGIEPAVAQQLGVYASIVLPVIEKLLPDVVGGLYDGLAKVLGRFQGDPKTSPPAIPVPAADGGGTMFHPY
jgi:hypothetical protein